MKPIVLATWKEFRLVYQRNNTTIERRDGKDAMGVTRWIEFPASDWPGSYHRLFSNFAEALNDRRRRVDRARRRRREGR